MLLETWSSKPWWLPMLQVGELVGAVRPEEAVQAVEVLALSHEGWDDSTHAHNKKHQMRPIDEAHYPTLVLALPERSSDQWRIAHRR
jgi:hypothetical protein